MRFIFLWKCSKVNIGFKNAKKIEEKVFLFWDNDIWIGCVSLSLFRREYMSSAVNVLTNSLKILHITKREFFRLNCVQSYQWIWWRCCRSDSNIVWACLPCCLSKGPLKEDFLDNYLTTFFGVRNCGNPSAMRFIFFWKCSKVNIDFKNAKKIPEKVFCFWGNCIWIVCVKLSLLGREYLS